MTRKPVLRQLGMTILMILAIVPVAFAGGPVRGVQWPAGASAGRDQGRIVACEQLKQILLKDLMADTSVQRTIAAFKLTAPRFIALAAGATRLEVASETCRDGICRLQAKLKDSPTEIGSLVAELSKDERQSSVLESAGAKVQLLLRELEKLKVAASAAKGNLDHNTRYHQAVQELAAIDRLQEGIMLLARGMRGPALESFSLGIQADPKLVQAYKQRGYIHGSFGNCEKALEDFNSAAEFAAADIEVYMGRGAAYACLRDFDKAVSDYGQAAVLGPTNHEAFYQRALALAAGGNLTAAIGDYDRVLALRPTHAMAYLQRAETYDAMGDSRKAVSDYTKAIELNLAFSAVYVKRGAAFFKLREYGKAVKDFDAAVVLNPADLNANGLRKEAYAALGIKETADPEGRPAAEVTSIALAQNIRSRGEVEDSKAERRMAQAIDASAAGMGEKRDTAEIIPVARRDGQDGQAGIKKDAVAVVRESEDSPPAPDNAGREKARQEDIAGPEKDTTAASGTSPPVSEERSAGEIEPPKSALPVTAENAAGMEPGRPLLSESDARKSSSEVPQPERDRILSPTLAAGEASRGISNAAGHPGIQAIALDAREAGPRMQRTALILYARSETGTSYDVQEGAERKSQNETKSDTPAATETPDARHDDMNVPKDTPPVVFEGILQDPYGKPLVGATIEKVDDPSVRAVSEAGGRFSLPGLGAASEFVLKAEMAGYLPLYISSLQYPPGAAATVFTLYPASPAPQTGKVRQPVSIEADRFRYDRDTDTYFAEGHVVISYAEGPGGTLTADEAKLSKANNLAEATGHVVVTSGKDSIYGDRIVMNIDTKEGSVYNGRMFISQNHFYVKGDRIDKTGEATYHIENASATTCDGDNPDWRILGKELDVTVDGYGTIKQSRFLARDFPVIYAPYFVFPAKTTRQSGFLFPYMSYSRDKLGFDVELPFYWAISKNMDATFYQRNMTQRGFKEGMEFRYTFSPDHYGTFYADFLDDRKRLLETNGSISRDWQPGEKRWSVYLNHISNFTPGFYLRSDIAKVSDNWYFKDFSDHNYYLSNYSTNPNEKYRKVSFVADESINSLDSTVRLVKDWQTFNLTGLVKYTDDFTKQSNDTTLQKFPEVTLTGIRQPLLGSRVYYDMSSVYGYYYRVQGQRGQNLDIKPNLSLPFNLGTALQVTPVVGWEGTFWERDDSQVDTGTRRGTRQLFNMGGTLTTEMQRIFNVGGETVDKIRHSIKPEVTYTFIPNVDQTDIPDYVPTVAGQNAVTYAVTNTVTGRLKDKAGNASYKEYARLKLFQTFDIREARRDPGPLDSSRRPFSDVNLELDTSPIQYVTLSARNKFSVNSGAWTQTNYDLTLSDPRGDTATVGYRYTQNLLREVNLSLKGVITKNWEMTYFIRRNEDIQKNTENTIGLQYRQQCWSVKASFTDKVSYDAAGLEQPDRSFTIFLSFYGLGAVGH